MEQHYICTGGCRGESDKPGACKTPGCTKEGQPLTSCECEDGEHNGAFKEQKEKSEEEDGEK